MKNKLNNKGFTVIEVVVSFSFVVILLTSMFAIVINYQNQTEKEKIESSLLTYRNTILEVVYNDIVSGNMEGISSCGDKCIMINTVDNSYKLESSVNDAGEIYIDYRDTKYILPDSKNGLSTINKFDYSFDDTNSIYSVIIPVVHAEFNDEENNHNSIHLLVSGKEFKK